MLRVYLGVEQGCGRGLGRQRALGGARAERLVQVEEGANDPHPQAAHPGHAARLQAQRQAGIQTVVSAGRKTTRFLKVSTGHPTFHSCSYSFWFHGWVDPQFYTENNSDPSASLRTHFRRAVHPNLYQHWPCLLPRRYTLRVCRWRDPMTERRRIHGERAHLL